MQVSKLQNQIENAKKKYLEQQIKISAIHNELIANRMRLKEFVICNGEINLQISMSRRPEDLIQM